MKKIYLHIGTHKSGTTTIQAWFAHSSDILAEHGILYPEFYINKNNAGHHFLGLLTGSLAERKAAKPLSELLELIERAPEERIFLSTELMSMKEPYAIRELFQSHDCKVIVHLRRQDDFIESMFRELIKSSYFPGNKDAFLDKCLAAEPLTIFTDNNDMNLIAPLPVDYAVLLDKWASEFGRENMLVALYDDDTSGVGALAKIQRLLGLPEQELDGGNRNLSFATNIIQARALIDVHLDWKQKLALRPAFWRANQKWGLSDRSVFYGPDDRRKIWAHVHASNERVRQEYFPDMTSDWLGIEQPTLTMRDTAKALSVDDFAKIAAVLIEQPQKV